MTCGRFYENTNSKTVKLEKKTSNIQINPSLVDVIYFTTFNYPPKKMKILQNRKFTN